MKTRADFLTNVVAALGTAIQPDELWQWICLILTVVSVGLSIAFTIYQWARMALADGKITAQEAQDLVKIIDDSAKEVEKIGVKK